VSALTRMMDRLGRDQAQLEADEVARECARPGCQSVESLVEREVAQVTGVVHSLAVPPHGRRPEVRVELYDGTGVLELIWLGRRAIAGIQPGTYLTVRGRVACEDDRLVMYNPGYDLLPSRG
jgi:RecG-like helicase